MLNLLAFGLVFSWGFQDRLAPILERWQAGKEEEKLQALRQAADLRSQVGEAALDRFAEAPVPESWSLAEPLVELVSRERIPSWYRLLMPLLKSPKEGVRAQALEALASRDLVNFSGSVVPLLRDPESRVAWQAAYTLIAMGAREQVPHIVPLLKDPEQSVRPGVQHALEHLGTREHGPLLAPLLDDPDPVVALAAVETLGRFQAREYAERISRFLEDPDPIHRQAAIAALARMNAKDRVDKIAGCLSDVETLVRWEALRALGRLKARDYAGQIVAAIEDDGGLAPALEALGSLGLRELSPHILPFLKTPDPGIRWRAVKALGDIDAKDDAKEVAEMLKDDDSFVRLCALRSLSAMGARDRTGAMLELLKDEDPDVCQGAAEEASVLATPEQIRLTLPLLAQTDAFVRWNILHLLVGADAPGALPAILDHLRRGTGADRDDLWAIGRLGGRDQADQVAESLRSEDGLVRQQAAFALARISDRTRELEAAERAFKGPSAMAAGFALVRLGRKTLPQAAALLRQFALHRDEPGYELFPDEVFDALAAGLEKDLTARLANRMRTPRRIETVEDLQAVLSSGGIRLAEGLPELRRRLPAGMRISARRLMEWSFGPEARFVPANGAIAVMDTPHALECWQKRLDGP